jgi:leucyl aminopeptidase (aminopeptidase T)
MSELLMINGARKLVEEAAAVKSTENVLIVTDFNMIDIAKVMAIAVYERSRNLVVSIMEPRRYHCEEPPLMVANAMKEADVIFAPTTFTLGATKARLEATDIGARVVNMPGYTKEIMLSDALNKVNLKEIQSQAIKIQRLLTKANEVYIYTQLGSSLKIGIGGRQANALTGIVNKPGEFGCLPNIETNVGPVEGTTEGKIVIDACILHPGLNLLHEPVELLVKDGFVQEIKGGKEAEKFRNMLMEFNDKNVYNIAELGIGLNPYAELKGSMLEDEGMKGSIHVALGTNLPFGGNIKAPVHIDMIILHANIILDNKVELMKDGELVL